MTVRKPGAEDRLEIRIPEIVSDVTHDMGEAAALEKEGVELELQFVAPEDRPFRRANLTNRCGISSNW